MGNPHVLVIPFPAQGHINPLMHFSQRIANLGIKITFVNTDFVHKRVLGAIVDNDSIGSSPFVNLVSIPDGLGSEDDRNDFGKLCDSILTTMLKKLEELIQDLTGNDGPISCIVADGNMGWVREVAEKIGIRVAIVWPGSAALFSLEATIPKLIRDGTIDSSDGFSTKKQIIQLSPRIPNFDTQNMPWNLGGDSNSQKAIFEYVQRMSEGSKMADWQLCNSTYDLEPEAFFLTPNLLPIGPLIANYNTGSSGSQLWQEDSSCLKWLDQQKPQSVIYVAFGSITIFNQTQFQELTFGLQLTEKPFLWVVRPGITEEYPDEFQGRNGKIVSWVPQQKVLSHPSIACFVSHCGWNSTIEGVSNGVPFLCWPYFADQFLNESYICEIWKVGLAFDKDENGIIRKGEIREKVDRLFNDKSIRERSLNLKQRVRDSVGEGGQSSANFTNFIKWLEA